MSALELDRSPAVERQLGTEMIQEATYGQRYEIEISVDTFEVEQPSLLFSWSVRGRSGSHERYRRRLPETMLDFESARQRFLQMAGPVKTQVIPLSRALGRVLAEDIISLAAMPEFDTSAMDGYAVNVDDVVELPCSLPVVGQSPAGSAPAKLQRNTAMRVFTGAAVPTGADAVVMQEHVQRVGQNISIDKPVNRGQNVRKSGEDLPARALALTKGRRLIGPTLSLVSLLDRREVEVAAEPRVAILVTGSELRQPGTEPRPGSIVESNGRVIAALVAQAGGLVVQSSIAQDDRSMVQDAIEGALAVADLLVTVGGVSVGDYDFVRPALQAAGASIELHQVAIKPGMPLTLGRRGSKAIVALPGNPASCAITFALFAMPLLRAWQGDQSPVPIPVTVPLLTTSIPDRTRTRILLGGLVERQGTRGFLPHDNQSSGATLALGHSDGFAILTPSSEPACAGVQVPYLRFTDL